MTSKYQIYLSQGSASIRLPVLPDRIDWKYPSANETVNIDELGSVTLLMPNEPLSISFEACFPLIYDSTCEYEDIPNPEEAIKQIQEMKSSGPIRIIISGMPFNELVSIEQFDVYEVGGDIGTKYYSIELTQYREIKVRQVQVSNGKAKIPTKSKRKDTRKIPSTKKVVKGDTLWKIAKKNNIPLQTLINLNKSTIKNPNRIYPGQVLRLK